MGQLPIYNPEQYSRADHCAFGFTWGVLSSIAALLELGLEKEALALHECQLRDYEDYVDAVQRTYTADTEAKEELKAVAKLLGLKLDGTPRKTK